jgi:hypothetical protein
MREVFGSEPPPKGGAIKGDSFRKRYTNTLRSIS